VNECNGQWLDECTEVTEGAIQRESSLESAWSMAQYPMWQIVPRQEYPDRIFLVDVVPCETEPKLLLTLLWSN
jgi:hypothetical protein